MRRFSPCGDCALPAVDYEIPHPRRWEGIEPAQLLADSASFLRPVCTHRFLLPPAVSPKVESVFRP